MHVRAQGKGIKLLVDYEAPVPKEITTDPTRPDRQVIAGLLAEMLVDVGVRFEQVDQRLFQMLDFEDCDGWEMSTWTWGADDGFAPLVGMLDVFDPQADPQARNYYQWGTGARSGQEDDPRTECDESEVLNYGPSAVIDEFTARFDELSREAEAVIDPAEYRPILEEMEQILVDQVVMIPLYLRPVAQAHREDILGGYGFKRQLSTEWFLWNVDQWYRADLLED